MLRGLATYLPGSSYLRRGEPDARSLDEKQIAGSARYVYCLWLRHLVRASSAESWVYPESLLELGPGDSLGVGIAALLSGVDQYAGLDAVRWTEPATNVGLLESLFELLRSREPIPGPAEFPHVGPSVQSLDFPAAILDEQHMRAALGSGRVEMTRAALRGREPRIGSPQIRYVAPWQPTVVDDSSVDMIVAQAVIQYVPDISGLCAAMFRWLHPGGVASLKIDYSSLGFAKTWDGHWVYPEAAWRLMRRTAPYSPNRNTHSAYREALLQAGFLIVNEERTLEKPATARSSLARPWRDMSEEDRMTRGGYILAQKPHQER